MEPVTMITDPRPRSLTPEMALRAALVVADRLVKNAGMDGTVEDIAHDIAEHGRPHMDGYELAKKLDNYCYWDCDLQIAEELDMFGGEAHREIERAQKEWVERNNITPQHPVGARVKLPRGEIGVITGIYEHGPAQYLVAIDGDALASLPTNSRRIVNFEDAEAA
jgi:hypothetical protein